MKKIISILIVLLGTVTCWAQSWTAPDIEDYQNSTIINFEMILNGALVDAKETIQVAAFVDNNCRGVAYANDHEASVASSPSNPEGMIRYGHLAVYGNLEDVGKSISLKTMIDGVEYTFCKQYVYDGETHGELSQLESFSLVDFAHPQAGLTLDDIHLHLTDNPMSENIISQLRFTLHDAQTWEVTYSTTLGEVDALPTDMKTSWQTDCAEIIYDSSNAVYLKATKRTNKNGSGLMGTLTTGGRDFYIWSTIYVEPYDLMDWSVMLRMNDVHMALGETHDFAKDIFLLFPIDEEIGEGGATHYQEVPYSEIEAFLGYVPTINIHPYTDNLELEEEPMTYRAVYPTTRNGMRIGLSTMYQNFAEGQVFITPYDVLDDHVEITLQTVDCDYRETKKLDLRDYITIRQYNDDRSSFTVYSFADFFEGFETQYGYEPQLQFRWQDNETYSIAEDGYTLTIHHVTTPDGVPLNGWFSHVNEPLYSLSNTLFVRPFDRLIGKVELLMQDIVMERGTHVDAREYMTFRISQDDESVDVTLKDLDDYLGYEPDITWTWPLVGNGVYTVGADGYTLTALRSTTEDGYPLSVAITYRGLEDRFFAADATVYVTPFTYFDSNVTLHLDDFTVVKGSPVDLRDHLTFAFSDDEGKVKRTVRYNDIESELGYCPDFQLRQLNTENHYRVDGFMVYAVEETEAALISIMLDAAELDYVYRASATVTVIVPIIPLEKFDIAISPSFDRFVRCENLMEILPADAVVDPVDFSITYADSDLYQQHGWAPLHWQFRQTALGLYLDITPCVVGPVTFTVHYDNGTTQVSKDYTIFARGDQMIKGNWAWYTFYNLKSEWAVSDLSEEFFFDQIVDIRSQDATTYYDSSYGYFGDLTSISAYDCVKVKSNLEESTTYYYDSTYGTPTSLTYPTEIVLEPGWNWIPYPYQYPHTLQELATVFPTAEGNRLVTFDSGFAEADGEMWYGDLEQVNYGEGIMLYNVLDEDVIVRYPRELEFSQPDFSTLGYSPRRIPTSPCHIDSSAFPNNMTVVARLAEPVDNDDLTIAAFVGDECRGAGRVVSYKGEQYFFITIHGKSGERVNFRLGDGLSEYPLDETLRFDVASGSLRQPVIFALPDTFEGISAVITTTAPSDIYDLSGRRLGSSLSHGLYIQGGKVVFVE